MNEKRTFVIIEIVKCPTCNGTGKGTPGGGVRNPLCPCCSGGYTRVEVPFEDALEEYTRTNTHSRVVDWVRDFA